MITVWVAKAATSPPVLSSMFYFDHWFLSLSISMTTLIDKRILQRVDKNSPAHRLICTHLLSQRAIAASLVLLGNGDLLLLV